MRRNVFVDLLPSGIGMRKTICIHPSLHILGNSDTQHVWNSSHDRFVPTFEPLDDVLAVTVIRRELAKRNDLYQRTGGHYPQPYLMFQAPVDSFSSRVGANHTEDIVRAAHQPL